MTCDCTLTSIITEPEHGKSTCDGMGHVVNVKIGESCAFGHHLEAGTRNNVLYLAQMHPKPVGGTKEGLWSPKRYFYGFYADSLFKSTRHFKPYADSKQFRFRTGLCSDENKVRSHGPVDLRRRFCACPSCASPVAKYRECKVKRIVGVLKQVNCPAKKVAPGVTTRGGALSAFAKLLKMDEFRAVRVAEDQEDLEGNFWLAKLVSTAFENEEECTFAGETIYAGVLVVRIQWLQFVRENMSSGRTQGEAVGRCYRLLPEERLLAITAIARIDPVKLAGASGRRRSPSGGIFVLESDEEERIERSI